MRVLIVDYSVGFGGAIKSIGLVLPRVEGIAFEILTCQQPSLIRQWYAGFPVHRFRTVVNYRTLGRLRNTSSSGISGWIGSRAAASADWCATYWNVLRIMSILRRRRIDLVHLNNNYWTLDAILAARAMGLPVVAHMRGYPSPESVRRAYPNVRKVIAVSQSVADAVMAGGCPADYSPVVRDPVDLDQFSRVSQEREPTRAALRIRRDEIAVGMMGRVVPWKGQKVFVEASLRALDAGLPIRPVIVGDASDEGDAYVRAIRAMAGSSPHADRFIFAGYQPEPAPYYHAMDIVVHASIKPEPFGMVVAEAMAAGKPVIAAAAGGPPEIIEAGVDGLLTAPGNVPDLVDAMARLVKDADLRRQLGSRAQIKANERFSIAQAAAATKRVWESALK